MRPGRHRLRRTSANRSAHPYRQLAKLWALRFLLDLGGWKHLDLGYRTATTVESDLLQTLGLTRFQDEEIEPKVFRRVISRELSKMEAREISMKGTLKKNLEQLGSVVGLTKDEQTLLAFVTLVKIDAGLALAAQSLGEITNEKILNSLAVVLCINLRSLRRSVGTHGLLRRSGLLTVHRGDIDTLPAQLITLDGLSEILTMKQSNVYHMMEGYVFKASKSTLVPEDFSHVSGNYKLARKLIQVSLKKKLKGTNILIYGPPGTGKSELARLLATEVGAELFEVSIEGFDGDELQGKARFKAYQLGQHFLHKHDRAIILFDEIEDVFSDYGSIFSTGKNDMGKAWVNRNLSENQVPSVWISNNIHHLDPAYLRRFDYIFKLDTPPRSTRARILKESVKKLDVSTKWIERVAENRTIPPAIVHRAAKVVSLTSSGKDAEELLENVLTGTMNAMGRGGKLYRKTQALFDYHVGLLNSDVDLPRLVRGLERMHSGRLCLYGPPGTGKSEFAKQIAVALDLTLVSKRASDLISPYVGQTEQNLARMFEEAIDEDAVLLLDEADSFLQDRQGALRSWEVSQVNELLTQMEDFDGIFICSTNLMGSLDMASLRRFDFKIQLDYMTADQAWKLYSSILDSHGYSRESICVCEQQFRRLQHLTPGDFATIVRQCRLDVEGLSPTRLLEGLRIETGFKARVEGGGIGFRANI